jgi:hypothetical protein
MARLFGPIDREVQIAEIRRQRMLSQLEMKRMIAQSREDNGSREMRECAPGSNHFQQTVGRVLHGHFSRSRRALGTEASAAG